MLHFNRIASSKGSDVAKKITVKNVWHITAGFLIMGLNFKILFVMFFMM